ncbi:hypothetical protein FGO68_gene9404 [Halteria grandinella]|uniref:Uncharacterized protein n=1 Tax=Halteria grandinella TaxID=5974 RepID=A0A8J8NRM6_HALGN|nr:hypothetical protein FGO68_gene9404 [Halteria grandinella]
MNNRDLQAALDAQQAIKPKQVMGQRQSNTPLIMLTRQSDQNFGHSAITPQQSRNAIRNMFSSAQTTRNSSKSPFLERLRSQQAGVKDQRVKINKLGDIQKSLDSLIVGTSAPILEHQNKQHQQQQHATIVTPQRQDSSTSTATLIEETEKRKKRFIFLSEKIREIKQREGEKRTFMTAPNILDVSISSDEERQDRKFQVKLEPIKEIVIVPKEVVSEYRSMLQEVLTAQKSVRQDTTDLEEIRQMIRQTRDNIDQHIGTVDVLKSKLINISRRSKLAVEHKNPPPLVASPRQVLKTSNSHRVLPALFSNNPYNSAHSQFKTLDSSRLSHNRRSLKILEAKRNSPEDQTTALIFSAKGKAPLLPKVHSLKTLQRDSSEDYETKTKMSIMRKLMDINGSMKEFSEGLEAKMKDAYTSRAGRKYSIKPSVVRSPVNFESSLKGAQSVEEKIRSYLRRNKVTIGAPKQ